MVVVNGSKGVSQLSREESVTLLEARFSRRFDCPDRMGFPWSWFHDCGQLVRFQSIHTFVYTKQTSILRFGSFLDIEIFSSTAIGQHWITIKVHNRRLLRHHLALSPDVLDP